MYDKTGNSASVITKMGNFGQRSVKTKIILNIKKKNQTQEKRP
jgi:hypothetical protein